MGRTRSFDHAISSSRAPRGPTPTAPRGTPNAHSVLPLHGNNFGGFYQARHRWPHEEGFRVVVQIRSATGRSSKPIAPYNLNAQARSTFLILQKEKIGRAMVVGHSMSGMLAAGDAVSAGTVEGLVIYNPSVLPTAASIDRCRQSTSRTSRR
jgi:pimeloyl-ACP methyl ester carboxylesterase